MKRRPSSLAYFLLLITAIFYNNSVMAELPCMKSVQNEEDINICQHTEAKRLELELIDLEKSIRNRFTSPQTERFDEAQNRWQQMTENDCEIEADFYEGAPIYQAIQSECLQRHYRDRMLTLKNYLCPEYSLGNGCETVTITPVELPPPDSRIKRADKPQKIKSTQRFR